MNLPKVAETFVEHHHVIQSVALDFQCWAQDLQGFHWYCKDWWQVLTVHQEVIGRLGLNVLKVESTPEKFFSVGNTTLGLINSLDAHTSNTYAQLHKEVEEVTCLSVQGDINQKEIKGLIQDVSTLTDKFEKLSLNEPEVKDHVIMGNNLSTGVFRATEAN
ncbi:hypothetical protein DSO57_1001640 [Entomophthora muscae]|uniref:Uncharacterized protein n=1 Tax=Entomophthora muscae TaxID=34485 RepID=A0ACC2S039_9FUNG|nr:hypothetical protein DSO57_1001640 [Entomophthora muscae]